MLSLFVAATAGCDPHNCGSYSTDIAGLDFREECGTIYGTEGVWLDGETGMQDGTIQLHFRADVPIGVNGYYDGELSNFYLEFPAERLSGGEVMTEPCL